MAWAGSTCAETSFRNNFVLVGRAQSLDAASAEDKEGASCSSSELTLSTRRPQLSMTGDEPWNHGPISPNAARIIFYLCLECSSTRVWGTQATWAPFGPATAVINLGVAGGCIRRRHIAHGPTEEDPLVVSLFYQSWHHTVSPRPDGQSLRQISLDDESCRLTPSSRCVSRSNVPTVSRLDKRYCYSLVELPRRSVQQLASVVC